MHGARRPRAEHGGEQRGERGLLEGEGDDAAHIGVAGQRIDVDPPRLDRHREDGRPGDAEGGQSDGEAGGQPGERHSPITASHSSIQALRLAAASSAEKARVRAGRTRPRKAIGTLAFGLTGYIQLVVGMADCASSSRR